MVTTSCDEEKRKCVRRKERCSMNMMFTAPDLNTILRQLISKRRKLRSSGNHVLRG